MSSNSGTKLSFSFGAPAQAGPSRAAAAAPSASAPMSNLQLLLAKSKGPSAPKPKAPIFGGDEDEDESESQPAPISGPSKPKAPKSLGNLYAPTVKAAPKADLVSRAERRRQEEALRVDANVFDYDGVYDTMKSAERQVEAAKKAESEERKPRYIENFLASAQTRRLDRLRAEEKMLALEREKEGGEFDDKEKFVTEAYKKQMEEVRKAEAEEKAREEALRKSKKGPGLSAFYKTMLEDESARHAAAVEATASGSNSGAAGPVAGPSLAIRPPTRDEPDESYEPDAELDPFLARQEASAASAAAASRLSGKEVDINDEGEVVDKRSLLKAGLNIMKKPKPTLPNSLLSGTRSKEVQEGPYVSRAVGAAATYAERMAREKKRLAEQMRADAEKREAERAESMRREEEEARRRREGDDGEAERRRAEARARFLERKRARESGKGVEDEADTKRAKGDTSDQ